MVFEFYLGHWTPNADVAQAELRCGLRLSYRVAIKELFYVAAGFSLRLHRRDACATL
jgi:hypothetical protein